MPLPVPCNDFWCWMTKTIAITRLHDSDLWFEHVQKSGAGGCLAAMVRHQQQMHRIEDITRQQIALLWLFDVSNQQGRDAL